MDENFNNIKKKIEEIGSAILYNHSNAEIKLSTQIITTLKVDDGTIWFMIPRCDFNSTCENAFPIQLDYYRKGKPFYLKVYGSVNLIPLQEEINCLQSFSTVVKAILNSKMMLVRVNVLSVDLFDHIKKRKSGWLLRLTNYLYELLFPSPFIKHFTFPVREIYFPETSTSLDTFRKKVFTPKEDICFN